MVYHIIRADILRVAQYFSEPHTYRGEEKCEQWAKCPRVLYVKPSNKRFTIPLQKGVILIQFYLVKAWPNARNISTQHLATFLGTTCCVRLATLLRHVAMCCNMLDQIWKRSNFSCNILDVAWCCTRLATFTQHCCARACALGIDIDTTQSPPYWSLSTSECARGLGLINGDMLRWMLRAFGQPVQ